MSELHVAWIDLLVSIDLLALMIASQASITRMKLSRGSEQSLHVLVGGGLVVGRGEFPARIVSFSNGISSRLPGRESSLRPLVDARRLLQFSHHHP